jgi:hypothetical protein
LLQQRISISQPSFAFERDTGLALFAKTNPDRLKFISHSHSCEATCF